RAFASSAPAITDVDPITRAGKDGGLSWSAKCSPTMTPKPDAETKPTIQRPSSNDNRLPEHVDAAVRSVAELHAEHQNDATKLQRTAHRITAKFAQPAYIIALTALIAA